MVRKIILSLMILTIALSGCGKNKADSLTETQVKDNKLESEPVETQKVANEEDTALTVDDLVEIQYSKEGSYDVSYDETSSFPVEYSYKLPKINDESDAANSINDEIYEKSKESIELVESIIDGSAEEIYEPNYIEIDYDAYLNGNILSIVLKCYSPYSDWVDYKVFNYNVETKEIAANEELLKIANIDDEELIASAKKTFGNAALQDLDDYLSRSSEEEYEVSDEQEENRIRYRIIADYISDYAETINDRNITKDIPIFFDEDGNLCGVGLVSVPAGAGQYYRIEKIENKLDDAIIKKYLEYVEKYHYDGFEKDILGLYDTEGFSCTIDKNGEEVYLGFDSNDVSRFTMQFYSDDRSDVYLGTLKFKTIDENGIAYTYELTEKNGTAISDDDEKYSGSFYLNYFLHYDKKEDDYVSGAEYKYIDGTDMLDSDGNIITFNKTFG